jgi:hypothetical protein
MTYEHRKDDRTDEEFDKAITTTTSRECKWSEVMVEHYSYKTKQVVECKPHGVDMTGKVFKDNKPREYDKQDFKFVFPLFGREEIKEVVTAPEKLRHYLTIKTFKVKKAAEDDSEIVVCRLNEFYVLDGDTCRWMLDNLVSQIYRNFSPNDKALRIALNYMLAQDHDWYKRGADLFTFNRLVADELAEKHRWHDVGFEDRPSAQQVIRENIDFLSI